MLPVGIAHPLKVDHTEGPVATIEDDSEQEEFEDILKGSSNKDTILPRHHSNYGSSSKEDQSSDDNEEQNASSSAETVDSSSSSSDEDEGGGSQVVPPEILHKETYKRENKEIDPSHVKPKAVMKSPYMEQSATQSHSYGRSSKFVILSICPSLCVLCVCMCARVCVCTVHTGHAILTKNR